jgi:hypothetical protein
MSQLKVDTITDEAGTGSPSLPNGLTVGGVNYPSTGPLSNRNKIINGAMVIDQRNAGAAVNSNALVNPYVVDRWRIVDGGGGTNTFKAERSSVAPVGFVTSFLTTALVATSFTGTNYHAVRQPIEGFNCADLMWGTASAATVTLSFWVRSSLTGTFGGAIGNQAGNRSYPFIYTVTAANTWEYKTIVVEGDTTGTWPTDNTGSINLFFSLGSGPDREGTAGAWNANFNTSATGAVDVNATNGATFQITGVQLEAGTVATPFEHRSFGQELALCQRYAFVPRASTLFHAFGVSSVNGTTPIGFINLPVTMRVAPTLAAASAGSTFLFGSGAPTSILLDQVSESNTWIFGSGGSGGTDGFSGRLLANNTTSAFLSFSAEL